MFFELAQLAIGNLARARARLLMTAGGVLVGTTAVILLIALTIGLQTAAEASIGSSVALTEIWVYPAGMWGGQSGADTKTPQLDIESVQKFWRIPGVAVVMPIINLQGNQVVAGKLVTYPQIIGLDPRLLPYLGFTAQQGQPSLQPGEVIIGARVGEGFFDPTAKEYQQVKVDLMSTPFKVRLNQYTGQQPQVRNVNVKPAALLAPGSTFDFVIFMNVGEVIKLNEWVTGQKYDPKKFRFDQVLVRSTSRETTNAVSQSLRKMGYNTGGAGEYLDQLNGFFGTLRLMLGGVGGVALLVAAFGVANTMTMAILERTKEIGLMKAVGATDRDILTVFLIEAGLVGLAGGLAGVALSLLLQNAINQAVKNAPTGGPSFLPVDPSMIGDNLMIIPPELMGFALLLATGVGLLAGLYPSLRAAHLPPVVALKTE